MEVADCVRDTVEGGSPALIIAAGVAVAAAAIIGAGGILYCVWKRRATPRRDSSYKPMGNLEEEFEMSDLRQTPDYRSTASTMVRSTGTFMFQSPPTPKRSLAVTIPIPPPLPL
ncbi:unnamed protein product [Allacma fusca]|uniref:Uncharacterized protein n=2 Tax=Allacma fusca TaxID=39272 RepID=A0A8J2JVP4_9HEXA|nr:unnamed protein product [Allacma fusca]